MPNAIIPAAEFQSLPLEFVIASPLTGAVKAQAQMAEATKAFLEAFKGDVAFDLKTKNGAGEESSTTIQVPLLSIVPVPHLQIDSLTVNFKYEISQIFADKESIESNVALDLGTTGVLSNFVKASLKGSVASRSSSEATTNRSGCLEITMHASEAPIPEGLARVLSLLAHSVPDAQVAAASTSK
jgi:hypothetical protein